MSVGLLEKKQANQKWVCSIVDNAGIKPPGDVGSNPTISTKVKTFSSVKARSIKITHIVLSR